MTHIVKIHKDRFEKECEVLEIFPETQINLSIFEQILLIKKPNNILSLDISGWKLIHPIYKCNCLIKNERSKLNENFEKLTIWFDKNNNVVIH